jgi:hypothetical protein
VGQELKEALRQVMAQPRARQVFAQRKAMVEPVFSMLRERQGLNRFRRRGLRRVRLEFRLHLTAYNLGRALAYARRGRFLALVLRLTCRLSTLCPPTRQWRGRLTGRRPAALQRPMDPGAARFGVKCGGEKRFTTPSSVARGLRSTNGTLYYGRVGD